MSLRKTTISENTFFGVALDKFAELRMSDMTFSGNGRRVLKQGERDIGYGAIWVGAGSGVKVETS